MKPEQFIREFGVEKAREVVAGASDLWFAYDAHDQVYIRCGDIQDGYSIDDCEDCFLLEDLKRLVESLEIVNRACGAERVIDLHERYKNNPVAHKYWLGVRVDRMAQAVTDYESIYGGE
ncbi:TPA: hypothetical protein U2Q76_000398 [Acinetobacter baumannii]|nr:hypothetical protein [Acinetobacter baumannii]